MKHLTKLFISAFCVLMLSCSGSGVSIEPWDGGLSVLQLKHGRKYFSVENINYEDKDGVWQIECNVMHLELAENDFNAAQNRIFRFDIYNHREINHFAKTEMSYFIRPKILNYGDILAGYKNPETGLITGSYYQRIKDGKVVFEEPICERHLNIVSRSMDDIIYGFVYFEGNSVDSYPPNFKFQGKIKIYEKVD